VTDKQHLLGVDIGTYSAKGVIVHRDGTVKATRAVDYAVSFPRPGWAEHDADAIWWSSLVRIVRHLLAVSGVAADDIAAVGCSAIGITMLPVDANGRPLRPSVLYGIDTRAVREIAALNAALASEAPPGRPSTVLSVNSIGPKIRWFRDHEPELFARTHKVLTASSYLAFKLTGAYAVDAYSVQGFEPLYDGDRQAWDPVAARHVCDLDLMPTVHEPTDVVGTVHGAAAAETGLVPGTPVIAGTVDAAAEALSIGVAVPGETMLMLGTTAFLTQVLAERHRHPGLWSAARFLAKGTYGLSAGLATSAALTRWFKDNFGQPETAAAERDGTDAYGLLAEQAAAIPAGSEGLIVLPYFSGERAPLHDPRARGVIAGLTLSHTRMHLYRALLEGVAYSIRHNLEVMASIGADPPKLTTVGGGTKNALWLQIIADCTGRRLEVPAQAIGASFGDAYLAGVGAGIFPDFEELRRSWITIARSVEPNDATRAVYDVCYDVYRRTYPNLRAEMHDLADLQAGTRGA